MSKNLNMTTGHPGRLIFSFALPLMVGNILPLVVSELEVQDIDNQTDWEIAEMKYCLMKDK